MFDYLVQNQEKNEGKRLRIHCWKQAFHSLRNTTIILNEYSAGIILQKVLLQYTIQYTNIIPFSIYCDVKIYPTAKNVNQKLSAK